MKEVCLRVTLRTAEGRIECRLPYDQADFVVSAVACSCGDARVQGAAIEIDDRETYGADAYCVGCGARRGRLLARVSTIFGIQEDEAVLNSRCKIY